jgi:hypothetical protein
MQTNLNFTTSLDVAASLGLQLQTPFTLPTLLEIRSLCPGFFQAYRVRPRSLAVKNERANASDMENRLRSELAEVCVDTWANGPAFARLLLHIIF